MRCGHLHRQQTFYAVTRLNLGYHWCHEQTLIIARMRVTDLIGPQDFHAMTKQPVCYLVLLGAKQLFSTCPLA